MSWRKTLRDVKGIIHKSYMARIGLKMEAILIWHRMEERMQKGTDIYRQKPNMRKTMILQSKRQRWI